MVTGVMVLGKGGENKFQVFDWTSAKQRRVSHSSYGAEILLYSAADDRGFFTQIGHVLNHKKRDDREHTTCRFEGLVRQNIHTARRKGIMPQENRPEDPRQFREWRYR